VFELERELEFPFMTTQTLYFIILPLGKYIYFYLLTSKLLNRDATYFVMQSSTTCWAIAINDYGAIVSTLLAMSTFAALFFFVYVLHRTLKSRTATHRQHQQSHKNSEKHKRKKRKHANGRNHQKSRAANEVDQDSALHNATPKDGNTTGVSSTEMIQSDDIPHVLPPLAEDEPLDSPTTNGALFTESLVCLAKYESPQHHYISSRSRTASTSTADSVACSLDDQSSCSGRSTPTPISANESTLHPPFVTTPVRQSSSYANTPGERRQTGAMASSTNTPNQSWNPNPRRNNNRRSGKKPSSQSSSELPTAVPASKSPSLTPSKRWDALKPSNRTTTPRPRQQQQQQQQQPPMRQTSRKIERSDTTHADVATRATRKSSGEQQLSSMHDNASNCKRQNTSNATMDGKIALQQTECFIPFTDTPNSIYAASPNHVHQGNHVFDESANGSPEYSYVSPTSDRIKFSGLNPNSNSWTGSYKIISKDESPPRSDDFSGNEVFGFDVPRFQDVDTSVADSLTQYLTPPKIETIRQQPNPFYANDRIVGTGSNEFSMQSELSTSDFDLSFLQNLPQSNIDSVENRNNDSFHRSTGIAAAASPLYVPSVDSTLMTAATATAAVTMSNATATCASSQSLSPPNCIRNYQYYHPGSHVRDNPFATSDDDNDDDDQIEAELLELGGQMVGSILDF
jgi:hypothetical protein